MDVKNILAHCDHTLLKQESTWAQIKEVCDDGLKYGCASVCIPASFVKQAADYVGNELKICTVIGFPNGYSTTAVKVFETEDAIRNGADEIDMVINIGWVKDQRWDEVLAEIKAIKASCQGRILKVIVETCLLTEAEKYVGYPYVWGGSSPSTSFDCSGFISWVINHSGWNVGRQTAQGLYNICTPVSPEQAKPGDLVFFVGTYDTAGMSHVGLYVGNSVMLHCGDPISYTNLNSSYWQQHFYCYGRLP